MKKKHLLLFYLLSSITLGFSQSNPSLHPAEKFAEDKATPFPAEVATTSSMKPAWGKSSSFNTKAFRDTLYAQSFTNGLPTNYTISNANQNNFVWIWDTSYIPNRGMLSPSTPSINSTTANDGFMILPADFYNTPMNAAGALIMRTWFTSAKITIPSTSSVFIKYEQFLRFCCLYSELVLEISTDSVSWDTYDATRGLPMNDLNAPLTNPVEEVIFDVSSSLANQTQFWYRFKSTGNSHYYWMIDDVLFMEGPRQDITLREEVINFNTDNYIITPFYNQIPIAVFPPISFSGKMTQRGWSTNTNVTLDANVHLSGVGNQYSSSFNAGSLSQGQDTFATTGIPRFSPQNLGNYQVDLFASGDSVDQFPGNESAIFDFTVSDSVYARDDNNFDQGIGPADYLDSTFTNPGGTIVGDRFGMLYVVEPRNSAIVLPKSVSYKVSANPSNIGVQIVPKIWLFKEDSTSLNAAFVAEVATSTSSYTVTSSDTNTFLTLPLNTGSAITAGLDSGQYVVGWEVTALPSGTTFEVLNDNSTALLQSDVSNFLWLAHEPGWKWTADNPGIRLNISSIPVGLENTKLAENHFNWNVFPNPTNGQFKLELESSQKIKFRLKVKTILGQTIYHEQINTNGTFLKNMDFSGFDKGVYFLSLENENERITKKVLIK